MSDGILIIDQCPSCHGHWLDKGELLHLRQNSANVSDKSAKVNEYYLQVEDRLKDIDAKFRIKKLIKAIIH